MVEKKTTPEAEAKTDYYEEMVEVMLFKDNKDYKDDVFVSVNGENCVIKRGIPVKVKRKFALVLEDSSKQDAAAMAFMEANAHYDGGSFN